MENEDQIVDQIGALMQQLSPEKQAQVIQKLAEMVGGGAEQESQEPMPEQTMSPEGGMTGKPAGY
tara:strand:- start:3216 stop:3410 length:195 start_codon:yes stop_codon:yes gene_type:complete